MTRTYDLASAEIVEEDVDSSTARLDRRADAILLEDALGPRPLRRALREDASLARSWGQTRAIRLRTAVEAQPVKASLYALGLGVVIGMLAAR